MTWLHYCRAWNPLVAACGSNFVPNCFLLLSAKKVRTRKLLPVAIFNFKTLFPLPIATYTISYHDQQALFYRLSLPCVFASVTQPHRWHDISDTISPKLGLVEVSLKTQFYPQSLRVAPREKWDHRHFLHIVRDMHVGTQPQLQYTQTHMHAD